MSTNSTQRVLASAHRQHAREPFLQPHCSKDFRRPPTLAPTWGCRAVGGATGGRRQRGRGTCPSSWPLLQQQLHLREQGAAGAKKESQSMSRPGYNPGMCDQTDA